MSVCDLAECQSKSSLTYLKKHRADKSAFEVRFTDSPAAEFKIFKYSHNI